MRVAPLPLTLAGGANVWTEVDLADVLVLSAVEVWGGVGGAGMETLAMVLFSDLISKGFDEA
jgi:hypothetical protein